MSTFLLHAGTILPAAVLAGLIARGRLSRLPSWSLYLVAILGWQLLVEFRPGLLTWPNYAIKDLVAVGLTLAIALQVSSRAFGRLERARRSVAAWVLAILAATAVYTWLTPEAGPQPWARHLALTAIPRIHVGLALLYAVVLLQAVRFGVPLDHVHKQALAGLTAFLLAYAVSLDQLQLIGDGAREIAGLVVSLCHLAVLVSWVRAAWRRGEVFAAFPQIERIFWPWAPAPSRQ